MPRYLIEGKTLDGTPVKEYFDQVSEKRALFECMRTIGWLQDDYQISTVPENFVIPEYEKPKSRFKYDQEKEQEVLRIYLRIREEVYTSEEYKTFCNDLVGPIIDKAIKDLWTDMERVATKREMRQELTEDVIREFLPKFDPEKGSVWRFLRRKVRSRVKKKWSRETYVYTENKFSKRPRDAELKKLALKEYLNKPGISRELEEEAILKQVISLAKSMFENNQKLPKVVKDSLFPRVVREGIHRDLLKSKVQLDVFEKSYGKNPMTEKEIAAATNRKQQTIHVIKVRAENNILKKI